MKNLIIIALIAINLALIILSGLDKGKGFFYAFPLMLLINLVIGTIAFVKKKRRLGITAVILFFVSPLIGFINFARVFPFLTR